MTLFQGIDRLINLIVRPLVVVLSVLVAGMLVLGIVSRTLLDTPMFGLEELVLFCVMWLYMLGAVLASRERSHLSADFVQVMTSNRRIINGMHLVATLISLLLALFIIQWSYELFDWALRKQQTTPVFKLPWYISQGSLFFASLLFVFYLIRDLIQDAIKFFKNEA